MISRDEAIGMCLELIGAGILSSEYERSLEEIVSCLEAEKIGRHEWGVSDRDLGILYISKREDLITEEDVREYDVVHRKLTFIPSVDERIIIESNVSDKIEETTGEIASIEEINEWFERL